jgi:hypothetical protein
MEYENGNGGNNPMRGNIRSLYEKVDNIEKIVMGLQAFFAPGAMCEQSRRRVEAGAAQTKWQWVAITVLAAWIGYVTRILIEHFQRTSGQ